MSVFSEGPNGSLQFVGDFERLYETDADPWGQSGAAGGERDRYYRMSRDHLVNRLCERLGERVEGLEIGCGHGHLLARLHAEVGGRWTGMDISKAALHKAIEMWPEHRGLEWVYGDISDSDLGIYHQYNVIIWSQMLWYIAEPVKWHQAVLNTMRAMEPGGLFVIHQAFLPPGEQRFALDFINGFRGTLRMFLYFPDLELLEARYRPDAVGGLHDGLMIFRRKP